MSTVIKVENLGKKYIISHQGQNEAFRYTALRDVIAESVKKWGKNLLTQSKNDNTIEEFWALKDVSFEVKQGERLGIIGRNGAGKSTLLKILSRITEPTTGKVTIKGRVASLLEVGTGFHPELTGRENVFLNGAILGMTRFEIRSKFDEIVAFAEVDKFLDTPVKRYSSGMYVRLAFAVAAHLDPEILLVDEVLAVGDATFQKKCLGKISEVAKAGRTVLFVSHNMGAISRLCDRVLWIDSGCINLQGVPNIVVSRYMTSGTEKNGECVWKKGISREIDSKLKITAARIKNSNKEVSSCLGTNESFTIEIEYEIFSELPWCRVGFILKTVSGDILFESHDADDEKYFGKRMPGKRKNICIIPGNLLSVGRYFITINAGIIGKINFAHLENVLMFEIEENGSVGAHLPKYQKQGIICPALRWCQE